MSAQTYQAKARQHWTKWLPNKVAELTAEGQLEAALQTAGKLAQARVLDLMEQRYQQHEAEEVALSEYILLPPEGGAGAEPWETEELARLEREYQSMMRSKDWTFRPGRQARPAPPLRIFPSHAASTAVDRITFRTTREVKSDEVEHSCGLSATV